MRWLGPDALAIVRPTGVLLLDFFCSGIQLYVLLSPYVCLNSFFNLNSYVLEENSWISKRYFMQTKHLLCLVLH